MIKRILFVFLFILLPSLVSAKTLIVPHVVVTADWSFGMVVVNTGENNDLIRYELWKDGELISDELVSIGARDRWYKTGATLQDGVYTIILRGCSDETYGIFIRIWRDTPVSETPLFSDSIPPDLQSYDCSRYSSWTSINRSYFYSWGGKCTQMGKWHWKRFRAILYEMYARYKDVDGIDPRPSLGDASARV